MKTLFEKGFGRDLKKIKDKRLLKQAQKAIAQVESASSLADVANLKKLKGIFVCFLDRKDIYRYFP